MTDQANALPDPVEPEVVYQSWDPPSGKFFFYVQVEDGDGGWAYVTKQMRRDVMGQAPSVVPAFNENLDSPSRFPDTEESLELAKSCALSYASRTRQRTRVVRKQALL